MAHSSSLKFQIEPLPQAWNEMVTLAGQHWHETEGFRSGQPFNPVYARFESYWKIGCFHQFTVRNEEGRMIGYAGMYLTPSMHSQSLIASEDTWFLLPEYRKGRTALNLVKFVESEMTKLGAVGIGMSAKISNGAGRILEYFDYLPVSTQYFKVLSGRADSADHPTAVKEAVASQE